MVWRYPGQDMPQRRDRTVTDDLRHTAAVSSGIAPGTRSLATRVGQPRLPRARRSREIGTLVISVLIQDGGRGQACATAVTGA